MIARLLAAALFAASLSAGTSARADGYPDHTIRFIVPYAAGGLPDTVARTVGQALGEALNQAIVVDNRAGGAGAMAANALQGAPADGYTFMVTDGPMLATAAVLYATPPFDAAKDFVPVSLIGVAPLYLAVNPRVKAKNLDELIALAKSRPGALNYGSSGVGSVHHLTAEAMDAGLHLSITHIPFRGSSMSVPAMVSGEVDMAFASPPSLMGFVKSGKARLIAINAAHRSPATPDVPALAERIPGFDFAFNVVVLAKPGTPPEAIRRISSEIAKLVKRPEVVEQFQKAGVDPVGATPEQTATALAAESRRITAAAKAAKLQPQ